MKRTVLKSLVIVTIAFTSCKGGGEVHLHEGESTVAETDISLNENEEQTDNELIPAGYRLFEEIHGDLNKDGIADYILIIKEKDKDNVVYDEYRGELDRNRRGIMIFFNSGHDYNLVLENRRCFSSENEDGGVYFAPNLGVKIEKSNLYIRYDHGRYGWWQYTFRHRNNDFELIGYDPHPHIKGDVAV